MRSFILSARIRVSDKNAIKEWAKYSTDRVMHESVAHACFVDVARLRIANSKMLVPTMMIGTIH